MRNVALIAALSGFAFSGMAATAQFPRQSPKVPRTSEVAGIESYSLAREGDLTMVEAFGGDGESIATCEVQWLKESTVMTCTMGNGERYQATWYAQHVEFASLDTGEHFSLHPDPERLDGATPSERQDPRFGWILRGTKSWEEVERDWGHKTVIFGSLLEELQITLGKIPGDRLFLDQQIRISAPPANFQCEGGGLPSCSSNDPCHTSELGGSSSGCCSRASQNVDVCCRLRTGASCCANSLCHVICPLNIYCDCFLDGWMRECPEPPC